MEQTRTYNLVEADPARYLDLVTLDRRAWQGYVNGESIADGEHTWRLWCEQAVTVVAESSQGLLGAGLAFPCRDGRYCVHKVMTDPAHRGQGIGTAVFKRLLVVLDTMGVEAFLTVDPANEAARKIYEAMGFTDWQYVQGYYRPDEDRLVLSRPGSAAR